MRANRKAEIQAIVDGLRSRLQPYDMEQVLKLLDLRLDAAKDALTSAPLADVPALQGEAKAYVTLRGELTRTPVPRTQE